MVEKNKKDKMVDNAFKNVKENISVLLKEGYTLTIKYIAPVNKQGGFHLRIDKIEENGVSL